MKVVWNICDKELDSEIKPAYEKYSLEENSYVT